MLESLLLVHWICSLTCKLNLTFRTGKFRVEKASSCSQTFLLLVSLTRLLAESPSLAEWRGG